MLVEIRAKNCFVFQEDIRFSMNADMRTKKFAYNVYRNKNFNILKTAGIYGPNNAGKTCLIKCIRSIKNILLNRSPNIAANIFSRNSICELGVTILSNEREFSYDIKYDVSSSGYLYESFAEIVRDSYGNEKKESIFLRDIENNAYSCKEKALKALLPNVARNNIIIYLLDTSKFQCLEDMKNILVGFAEKIDIIDMNNIPLEKTINLLKNKDRLQVKVVSFIKDADLDMEDFKYDDDNSFDGGILIKKGAEPEEKVLKIPDKIMDQIKLTSVYKGVSVPSLLFDSTGTKKIAALASYIVEGLEQGRVLIIDEIDSSIHFKLTRAIVSMFNNELNINAQLIFTAHDINLMDCKRLFRKEQIWFVHKDAEGVYLYSLAEFTAAQGIREATDITDKYKKGMLGALPEPDLINTLLNLKDRIE